LFGLLNIDKPAGLTSRDVVNRVQRLVKPHKVGHAGTLDPLATGVLIVALGAATRLVEYVQRMPKTYQASFLLGQSSDTEDIEGHVTALESPPIPTLVQLAATLPQFVGSIEQLPPAYSALKIRGQRAYALARRGETVELAPRTITIHHIDLLRYEYPELELRIRCGSGTYVRSLGRDIARALGTDAVMSSLRRLAIGSLTIAEAIAYDQLDLEQINRRLLPALLAVGDLPTVELGEAELRRVARGQPIDHLPKSESAEWAAVDCHGQLAAILAARAGSLWPTKCFVPQ
jgi:tRNA pseudouridine55 synthase